MTKVVFYKQYLTCNEEKIIVSDLYLQGLFIMYDFIEKKHNILFNIVVEFNLLN